jgi:cysteine synthase
MKSYPDEDTWTADDEANRQRTAAEVEKALERMYTKMVLAIGAAGILLGVAIHFLSTP